METVKLLQSLVRCKSVTANVKAVNKATGVLRKYLEERGVSTFTARTEEEPGREILYASTSADAETDKTPDYLFLCHVDVVPAPAEMFVPKYGKDGIMRCRGCFDCLGNAVVCARLLCGLVGKASVGVVFASDEEVGGKTSKWFADHGYLPKKLLIVADGGAYAIGYGEKGVVDIKVTASGRGGHSSRPWMFENAIDNLFKSYEALKAVWPALVPDLWSDTMAATIVSAGSVHNRVPDEAEMLVNIRFTKPRSEGRILKFVQKAVAPAKAEIVGSVSQPFCVKPDHPRIKALHKTLERRYPGRGIRLFRMMGATDGRHFADTGVPIAIIGTDGAGAHADEEWLRVANVDEYVELLTEFVLGN